MRRHQPAKALAVALALAAAAALSARLLRAQHATPSVDGSIGLTEYGTNNSQANGGTTWYMTWNDTNLYLGLSGANTSEGAVIYIDRHAIRTDSGTNADGNTTGQTYDSTNFSSLPFRADFVAYFKDGYREYRTADGAGGWSGPTTLFGAYASSGGTVRELSIPWSAVTGAGRPAQFNFFVYVTSPGGFVYGELPAQNPDGFIGTSAAATRFYRVADTDNGESTPPFSLNYAPSRTFVVNSALDGPDAAPGDNACDDGAGNCTLRAAIQEANAVTSYDAVNFNVGGGGPQTIAPASALPAITDPVRIDGYTQPGSSANTLATGNDAVLNIELNGAGAGAGVSGLTVTGGTTTLRGLVVNRFSSHGVELDFGDFNVVTGCFIGTDAGGTVDLGNTQDGVFIQGSLGRSSGNRIGGTLPAERNVISGNNSDGIGGQGGGANTIQGNYVGTDRTGTLDLGNGQHGVVVTGSGSTLGGTTAAARNVISGNGTDGVNVSGGGHTIQGNYIGTDVGGTLDLGNGARGILFNVTSGTLVGGPSATKGQPPGNLVSGNGQEGILIGLSSSVLVQGNLVGTDAAGSGAIPNAGDGVEITSNSPDNQIGGTAADVQNVIAFNGGDGLYIDGAAAVRNPVLSNSIHSNTGLGIDLDPNGVTANDAGDPDAGPNLTQNYPVLTSVSTSGGTTTVAGTLNSRPNSTYRVEFFSNQSCDASGNGEGQTFIGAKSVTTDGAGNATFSSDPLPPVPFSRLVTATATSVNNPSDASDVNNTSEFSQCRQELAPSAVHVVNTTADTPDASTADGLCLDSSGFCSLRAAIEQSNANPSSDTITFLIPNLTDAGCVSQTCTITPTSQLPTIIFPVTINAYTQPLALENSSATGSNAVPRVVLSGASAGAAADGLRITGGSSQVRGLVINGFAGDGIELSAAGGNLVYGNFIGTNADGTAAGPGNGGSGVHVSGGTSNTVGGDDDDDGLADGVVRARNVISSNALDGVRLAGAGTTSNLVQGNLIGTDKAGAADLGNAQSGVGVTTSGNTVGGSAGATPGTNAGNVISGNDQHGVLVNAGSSNLVQGNLIGLQADGATARANALDGVHVMGAGASGNTVGGAAVGFRNVISANANDGVELSGAGASGTLVASNFIGTDRGGTLDRGNGADGVRINGSSVSNTVGGLTSAPGQAPGNVISGNGSNGVEISAGTASPTNNTVQGNLIGTDRNGVALIRNDVNGILNINSSNNLIGGTTSTARNVITGGAGTGDDAVDIQGASSSSVTVQGNYIGTDINGGGSNTLAASDFGSGGDGVRITGGGDNHVIGGSTATPGQAPGNVISGQGSNGVEINGVTSGALIQGNLIGTQGDGITAYANGAEGVLLVSATSGTVGGLTETPGTGLGNVISGNNGSGVELSTNADSNTVAGNLIGLQAGGTAVLGNGASGVHVTGARLATIGGASPGARNVISGNLSSGVLLNEGQNAVLDNNTVAGNYIGTDITGALDLGNAVDGVRLNGADGVTVGGISAAPGTAPGNVISGNNGSGVELLETSGDTNTNTVQGNLIGTNAAGAAALPNALDGVGVRAGVTVTTVGGTAAGAGNVISGNGSDGVELASGGHTLQGNFIGTQLNGTSALGNSAHGVHVSAANTTHNTLGGTAAGAPNTIAFNGGDGVFIPTGLATLRRNSIHSNAGLGLDLGANGVTLNDLGDADAGANALQNYPLILDARTGSTAVTFTLNSTPSTTFQIDLFSSAAADPSAFGEGQTFLDSLSVTTDATGNVTTTHTAAATVPLGHVVTATATSPAGNTSEFSNTRVVLAPTLAVVREFSAAGFADGVLVEWQTSYEADNLGFRLYRDDEGVRTLLTPSLVAGSALTSAAPLTAGNSYAWFDPEGRAASRYLLEDVDLSGAAAVHGPVWAVPADAAAAARRLSRPLRPPTLEELGAGAAAARAGAEEAGAAEAGRPALELSTTVAAHTHADGAPASAVSPAEVQRRLAAGRAVKLTVRRAGWYRVTRAELEAAGLDASASPARLQLFAGGVEHPLALDAKLWRTDAGAVEFYGEGLDTPSTDARVYWLVEGRTPGRRVRSRAHAGGWRGAPGRGAETRLGAKGAAGWKGASASGAGGAEGPQSFAYTAELRERSIYFSSLLNGEAENFFGRVVNQTPSVHTVSLAALDTQAQTARVEVALQGVTASAHAARLALNGVELGTLGYTGRENRAETFEVPASLLREGANEVRLVSSAASDVSLLDYVRVTYQRLYRAEADALRLSAQAGATVRVSGFTSGDVRVVDVTDGRAPEELAVSVEPEGDAYAASFVAAGGPEGGERVLLAFTGARVWRVAASKANEPSAWHGAGNEADFVIVAHSSFREAVAPLAARRSTEGLLTRVVDVEDVFDEFSHGAHTPAAVRDFLAWARANWRRAPRYVLLVGDGSYDPRDRLGRGSLDFVPAKQVDTAAMETASDEWLADADGDGAADLALGRLPVRTAAEAQRVVSKIVGHQPGAAERRVLLVSDRRGADGFDFEAATDTLLPLVPADYGTGRINRGSRAAAEVRAEIVAGVNAGPTVVNWLGHGSVGVWTGDGLLRSADALALNNGSRLPLFMMMTCLNGYYTDPSLDSLGEALLKAEGGGALAVWASTGMTTPESQAEMNREVYRLLFTGEPGRLGDALRGAKASAADPEARRTWLLLGDPTTRLR